MTIHAFEKFGIEIEYAIVGTNDLNCQSIADIVLAGGAEPAGVLDRGPLGWSNEFVRHVLELKNLAPSPRFENLVVAFQTEVCAMNATLLAHNARLMPTAMHPWLDPIDARLWPIDPHGTYRTYQRIFETRTHGWTNLQSIHINLPFVGDAEFAWLHEAIRRVLPIIPALAASSPIAEGRYTGKRDFRMQSYRSNATAYPLINGRIIPDSITSCREYVETIIEPMYAGIASADPESLLKFPWLNARGAIPRFDRNTIEIRIVDTQECPEADLAVAAAVVAIIHQLYSDPARLTHAIATERLVQILDSCVHLADDAVIEDRSYLSLFDYPGPCCRAGDLWCHALENLGTSPVVDQSRWNSIWTVILNDGSLARRIERAVGEDPSRARLSTVYRELCNCLQEGKIFASRVIVPLRGSDMA